MIESARRKIKRSLYILQHEGTKTLLATIWRKIRKQDEGGNRFQRMLSLSSTKERFSTIYKENLWEGNESLSGSGSSLSATKNLRDFLPKLIKKYDIKYILDAPCGDFAWMNTVISKLGVNYIGYDIVDSVIEKNTAQFARKNVNFSVKDITSDALPPADLVIVRDCLFHFSYEDLEKFFKNLSRTDYKYLLTTNHIAVSDSSANKDIITGDFRPIYLFCEPFCFSRDAVLESVADFSQGQLEREMVLLPKASVPSSLRHR